MSRFIAWTAFLLGIGASVAANVAHAEPHIGPRLASAFAPLALVLAVELAVRVQWRDGWRWTVGRWGGTGLVAVVTAVVSYRHQVGLLTGYGEDSISAAIMPLSVDGLMITAAAALLALSGTQTGPAVEEAESGAAIGSVPSPMPLDGRVDDESVSPPIDTRDVYFLESETGQIKIGVARDLRSRLSDLQTMSPVSLRVLGVLPGAGRQGELELHQRFAEVRLRGEWFEPIPDLLAFISENAEPWGSGETPTERARAHWETERAAGRTPTGAELDRVAGTKNYGRALRRRWLAADGESESSAESEADVSPLHSVNGHQAT